MVKSSFYQLAIGHKNIFYGSIKKINEDHYEVPSSTQENKTYQVIRKDKKSSFVCQCPGFNFNGHCSHITTLRIYLRTEKK